MRFAPVIRGLFAVTALTALSGCYWTARQFGPPPPAYACDSYGCDGYGAFSECVGGGQFHSRRDLRQMRRPAYWGGRGQTFNGLPVVAAYIVPMNGGQFGGMLGNCGPMCGSCEPCGQCGAAMSYDGWETYPQGSPYGPDAEWQTLPGGELIPSEAYPETYQQEGQMLQPVPVPPADEGPWNPPAIQPTPRTTPEPEASRPIQSTTWFPTHM